MHIVRCGSCVYVDWANTYKLSGHTRRQHPNSGDQTFQETHTYNLQAPCSWPTHRPTFVLIPVAGEAAGSRGRGMWQQESGNKGVTTLQSKGEEIHCSATSINILLQWWTCALLNAAVGHTIGTLVRSQEPLSLVNHNRPLTNQRYSQTRQQGPAAAHSLQRGTAGRRQQQRLWIDAKRSLNLHGSRGSPRGVGGWGECQAM
jgi:hypothetical protein